jgi:hypothetical protein
MAVDNELAFAEVDDLWLDPNNPRLEKESIDKGLSQAELLEVMKEWTVEELAISFIESGFWTQEALIVVEEKLAGATRKIVVEGNRRLAALKLLEAAKDGKPTSKRWAEIIAGKTLRPGLFAKVPYLLAEHRRDVEAYLGFRHVTGIKQWEPAQKAAFIAHLIDDEKMSYEKVMRRIGSKTEAVRRNYISYRILRQMADMDEQIHIKNVEKKFSVLFLSLRTEGVRTYLDVDILADPKHALNPVPKDKLECLVNFAKWLFGTEDDAPIINDSRQVEKFAKILTKPDAVKYLERNENPKFEVAYRMAGGEEFETVELVRQASDRVREALATVHHHSKSKPLAESVKVFGVDSFELLKRFPAIKRQLIEDDAEAEKLERSAEAKKPKSQ